MRDIPFVFVYWPCLKEKNWMLEGSPFELPRDLAGGWGACHLAFTSDGQVSYPPVLLFSCDSARVARVLHSSKLSNSVPVSLTTCSPNATSNASKRKHLEVEDLLSIAMGTVSNPNPGSCMKCEKQTAHEYISIEVGTWYSLFKRFQQCNPPHNPSSSIWFLTEEFVKQLLSIARSSEQVVILLLWLLERKSLTQHCGSGYQSTSIHSCDFQLLDGLGPPYATIW